MKLKIYTKTIYISFLLFSITIIPITSFAHWTSKGPFVGGNITCFTIADTLLYAGSATGGVYWSKTQALTAWSYANYTGLTSPHVSALTSIGLSSSTSGMKIIAGTSDGGIFVSKDKGTSWSASNSGLTNTNITALITVGQYLFAGTNGAGIFVSSDSAKTWTSANSGVNTSYAITSFATNGTVIVAGTDGGGVFASINNGGSWTAANTGLTDLSVNALAVSGTSIFAGTDNGIFTANVNTPVWSQANTGLSNTIINGFTTNAGLVYAATNAGVYTSPDASVSWTAANTGLVDTVNAVVVFNNKLYAGNFKRGIYRSTSLSTISWSMFNLGFNNLDTYAVYNSGNLVIVATNLGLYVSRDLAASYQSANSNLTDSLHITSLTFAGTKLYVATQYGGVFVSADTGKSWATANTGLQMNIKKIIATNSTLIAVAGNGAVYYTPQASINWTIASGVYPGADVTSLATDGTTTFLGTNGHGVYVTADSYTWTAFNTGLSNTNVTSLAVQGTNVFAATNGDGIFISPVASASWTAVNNGLPTLNILSLCSAGQYLAAGYKGGVYITTSNGAQWAAPNVLLYIPDYADVYAISFSASSTRIFAATPSNTIYSNNISELPITAIQNPVSNSIGTIAISPNPNTGNFKLDLEDVKGQIYNIIIYDHSGKQVRRLANDTEQIVSYFQKGMYYIQIITDKGAGTQKMIVE
ncbi:MAG TPA: T9SS type A sorting domain-containing protein [Cytophagaceae bacterium]|nr:T9SS type A sorting domain-containing protein [Cytophagaceae bacterium]